MSEHETHKPDDIVDRAAAALRDVAVPDGPSPELLADTLSAIRAAEQGKPLNANSSRRRIFTMRFITKLAVAAVLVLFVGALVWTDSPWGSQAAFADVLEKVQQVKSVRFKVEATYMPPGATKPSTGHLTMLISGDRMRQEMPNGFTSVTDFKTGRVVALMAPQKKAIVMRMENMPKQAKDMNLLQSFRAMTPDAGKSIGRKEINGRMLDGYLIEKDGRTTTVWADPKTRLPMRMEAKVDMPMAPKSDVVMTDFQWDVPTDPAALSTDVPPGYDVQEMTVNAAKPTEKELIESLRRLATANNGTFPDSFDFAGATKVMSKLKGGRPNGQKPDKATVERVTRDAMSIVRGLAFVQRENGDDFHYAGKGVALGQAGRAIFWYRPAKSETYHVIDADLTVHTDVKADDLPKVESQMLATATKLETESSAPALLQATEGDPASTKKNGQ